MTKVIKHDQLFRKALENPVVAQEFFATHLPESIKSIMDSSTLKMENGSFVEPSLKSSVSDVLFSVKFNNEPG
jgi:predicted transposase/invertase (TIGR01784 family)